LPSEILLQGAQIFNEICIQRGCQNNLYSSSHQSRFQSSSLGSNRNWNCWKLIHVRRRGIRSRQQSLSQIHFGPPLEPLMFADAAESAAPVVGRLFSSSARQIAALFAHNPLLLLQVVM